jgi:uncharacterized membrane protein YraQ (UPF0718 family)
MPGEAEKGTAGGPGKDDSARSTWRFGLGFLGLMLAIYLVLFLVDTDNAVKSSNVFLNIIWSIIPILVAVVILMGLFNLFLKPKRVLKYLGRESGPLGWLLAISLSIISHGPIYAWYPLLGDLKQKGMRSGLVSAFLYNRSIKLPLLPIMIYYFGLPFVVILLVLTVLGSVIGGWLLERVEILWGDAGDVH